MRVNIKKPFLDKIVDEVCRVEAMNKPIESITFTTTEEVEELYKIFLAGKMECESLHSRKQWIKDFKSNKGINFLIGYPVNYEKE